MLKPINYLDRLKRLQQVLKETNCSYFLEQDPINIYYLTGLQVSCGKFLVHPAGACLVVDNRYLELCKRDSPFPVYLSEQPSLPALLFELGCDKTLGFDSENISYRDFSALQHMLAGMVLVPLEKPVKRLRMIKDQAEVFFLKEAASLCCEGMDFVISSLEEGIVEEQLALELEIFWKRKGARDVSFEPIIAFGPHTSMPHYRAGKGILKKGDPVLIDIGVNFHHYHSDMTRTVFFGEPSHELNTVYTIVLKAQLAAIALCRPGITIGELDQIARKYIASQGYGEYFTHGLGHGVGLEIHEEPGVRNKPPYKDMVLEPGMVITIEPGVYLPGKGGVRIEDTVVITDAKEDIITQRSKQLQIIAKR
jgi:Xaa-Pro aminopeptidase